MPMDTSDTESRTPHREGYAREKQRVKVLLSVLIVVIGAVLLLFMVTVEGEPGAIPLVLIVLGIGWYVVARARVRAPRP